MLAALLFAALLSGEPAAESKAAPAAAEASNPAPPKVAKADPDRVCKLEPVLGSKITKKVCYNRAQLDERTFYDKQNLDLMQAKTPGPFVN
jgi:hypothetical protein